MAGPFKMRGFSGFGNSPLRDTKDTRSWLRKGWDKATQLGMGAKAYLQTRDENVYKGIGSRSLESPWQAGLAAYRKEKAADIKRGSKTTEVVYDKAKLRALVEKQSKQ